MTIQKRLRNMVDDSTTASMLVKVSTLREAADEIDRLTAERDEVNIENDRLRSAAAELWWLGRASVKELSVSTATGPQLRDACVLAIRDVGMSDADIERALGGKP